MLDKPKFDPEKLYIVEIKLVSGQIETPDDFVMELVQNYDIENTLEISFSLEQKLVKVDFSIRLETNSKGDNKAESIGRYHFVFIYRVDNIEELTSIESDGLVGVDANLASAISAVSYSTARGILLSRMQGTAFQQFILPIINPTKLLKTP